MRTAEERAAALGDFVAKQLDARVDFIAQRIAADRYVQGRCCDRWADWTDAERRSLRQQVRAILYDFESAGFDVVNADAETVRLEGAS